MKCRPSTCAPDTDATGFDPFMRTPPRVPPAPVTGIWRCRNVCLPVGSDPLIMGVLNVTPDSFSDGGQFLDLPKASAQALHMLAEGAHIIDIGGESTRPGAQSVTAREQIARVIPAIAAIREQAPDAVLSVDTTNALVAGKAIEAGANIINDTSGLTCDPAMPALVRESGAGVVIMHMQGTPATMQQNPAYQDCIPEIHTWLQARLAALLQTGIARESIAIDPGIGFGKKLFHNLEILHRLAHFTSLGVPILVGASRKRFIGIVGESSLPQDRLPGSLAALTCAVLQGASILRVHDVAASRQAALVAAAVREPARWQDV